jgi:hypothetical protein
VAGIRVIDAERSHLDIARPMLPPGVTLEHRRFVPGDEDVDLVIVPLAFAGSREAVYRHPPAPVVLVHDWMWRHRGRGTIVAWWLLKRINLVER